MRKKKKKKRSSGVSSRRNGHLTPLSFSLVLLASAQLFLDVCVPFCFSFHFTNGQWVFGSAHDRRKEMGKEGAREQNRKQC